jgi:hypothetical protein
VTRRWSTSVHSAAPTEEFFRFYSDPVTIAEVKVRISDQVPGASDSRSPDPIAQVVHVKAPIYVGRDWQALTGNVPDKAQSAE